MIERLVGALTEEIYEAGAGGMPWGPVGQGLIRLVGAGSGSLFLVNPAEGEDSVLFRGDLPLEAEARYRRYYRSVDLWTARAGQAAARRGAGAAPLVSRSGTLVPDAEYAGSEFYADFGRQLGLRYVVGTVLPLGQAGYMPIGLHRPEGMENFGTAEADLLSRLLPHLRRSMQIRYRLRSGAQTDAPGHAVLDALGDAVVVVDTEMRVAFANLAAEGMAQGGTAFRLSRARPGGEGRGTLLGVPDRAGGAALAALVRATAAGGAGGAVALRDDEGVPAIAALVYPLPRRLVEAAGEGAGRVPGRALILFRDLAPARGMEPGRLRVLFGLTPAEAEIAVALAGGATKATVAAARGLQVSTVNSQVRAILAKSGAVNLRDLERLLASLPRH